MKRTRVVRERSFEEAIASWKRARTRQALQQQVYAWLGYWRGALPSLAVDSLQRMLGPLGGEDGRCFEDRPPGRKAHSHGGRPMTLRECMDAESSPDEMRGAQVMKRTPSAGDAEPVAWVLALEQVIAEMRLSSPEAGTSIGELEDLLSGYADDLERILADAHPPAVRPTASAGGDNGEREARRAAFEKTDREFDEGPHQPRPQDWFDAGWQARAAHQGAQGMKQYTRKLYAFEGEFLTGLQRDRPMRVLRRLAVRVARDHHRAAPVVVAGVGMAVGGRRTSYNCGDRIELVRRQRDKVILLHELAHWLQGERGHDHGPAFVKRYFGLLVRYLGLDANKLKHEALISGVYL